MWTKKEPQVRPDRNCWFGHFCEVVSHWAQRSDAGARAWESGSREAPLPLWTLNTHQKNSSCLISSHISRRFLYYWHIVSADATIDDTKIWTTTPPLMRSRSVASPSSPIVRNCFIHLVMAVSPTSNLASHMIWSSKVSRGVLESRYARLTTVLGFDLMICSIFIVQCSSLHVLVRLQSHLLILSIFIV
jgi:hypothetical protein